MKARLIKIVAIILGTFILTMSAFSDEYGVTGIGRNITLEKGVSNRPYIKDLPVNAVIRMNNIKNPNDIAKFGFPEDIVKSWAIIPIPTIFTSNFKLIIKGK